jgi:CelD/BcsL family acetyltransferase involved in cellulose biosynthesis
MQIEVIRTADELFRLEQDWRRLHARAADASPFQHPSWLLPWWSEFGSGELLSLALRDNGELAGFAPMFLHPWAGRRQVTLVGTGVSDRLGFVAAKGYEERLVREVFALLASERHRWDLCDLQDLPQEFAVPSPPETAIEHRFEPQYSCARVNLPLTPEEYVSSLPHGLRRNLRRYRAQLENAGDVEFTACRCPAGVQEGMEALFVLHEARWAGRCEGGMLGGHEQFHRKAARRMADEGVARCFQIKVGKGPIAALYGFLQGDRFWSYQTGFDPAYSRFCPGALILEHAISRVIAEGARVFDFLRGSEDYKQAWGACFGTSFRLLLWHSASRGL